LRVVGAKDLALAFHRGDSAQIHPVPIPEGEDVAPTLLYMEPRFGGVLPGIGIKAAVWPGSQERAVARLQRDASCGSREDLPHNVVVIGIVILGDQQPVRMGPQVHARLSVAHRVVGTGESVGPDPLVGSVLILALAILLLRLIGVSGSGPNAITGLLILIGAGLGILVWASTLEAWLVGRMSLLVLPFLVVSVVVVPGRRPRPRPRAGPRPAVVTMVAMMVLAHGRLGEKIEKK
jgi:hypothetical protein